MLKVSSCLAVTIEVLESVAETVVCGEQFYTTGAPSAQILIDCNSNIKEAGRRQLKSDASSIKL